MAAVFTAVLAADSILPLALCVAHPYITHSAQEALTAECPHMLFCPVVRGLILYFLYHLHSWAQHFI